jgi:2-polyprenyl-3-methyl-5-hydroxy-6-metoxy-1,4-benzoquinol methylase
VLFDQFLPYKILLLPARKSDLSAMKLKVSEMSIRSSSNEIKSPVTNGDIEYIEEIKSVKIIDLYQKEFGADVERFFENLSSIQIFRCLDSGYEFFYPFSLEGDPNFYAELYSIRGHQLSTDSDEKWEHMYSRKAIISPGNLLDIGAGNGNFLSMMESKTTSCTGLETNEFGNNICKERGFKVFDESIEVHADNHREFYDTVTAFQVLEHVADVASFLSSILKVLKKNGTLILSVPNNDSFLRYLKKELPLNMPPHHVGRWNRNSLEAIAKYFNLSLQGVEFEPLQKPNIGWYQSTMENNFLPKSKWVRRFYYWFGGSRYFKDYLTNNLDDIKGHTILAIYTNN